MATKSTESLNIFSRSAVNILAIESNQGLDYKDIKSFFQIDETIQDDKQIC